METGSCNAGCPFSFVAGSAKRLLRAPQFCKQLAGYPVEEMAAGELVEHRRAPVTQAFQFFDDALVTSVENPFLEAVQGFLALIRVQIDPAQLQIVS